MIDRATIQRVLDAADIVDVVKDFVTLRKAGVNYKGLCPFHDEKTPSFVVSPSKQYCKCFSCGKSGNTVGFIMEHEQMTFPEAIKWLGRKYGIEVIDKEQTDEEKLAAGERENMFTLNEWARDWFQHTLHEDVDGVAIGMAYFRSRGFRDDTIRKFQLGYSPERRDAFCKEALEKGFRKEYLVNTGLVYETEDGRLTDRYHGRVIFPVHNVSGRVVAFGGRILGDKQKHVGKYVNSPESAIYSKSRELYGLFLAKHAITKNDCCYLVEGYTDVISMHQSGVENVVASSGTSLTEGQIRLIHRFTPNITVLYDGDNAGIKASLRGIDMLLAEGMNIKVLLLPGGEDPDSFARSHTAQEFRDYIAEHQVDFIRFKTQLLLDEAAGDPLKRAGLIKDIVSSISVIPDNIVRQMYIRECTRLLDVREELIANEVASLRRETYRNKAAKSDSEAADAEQAFPPTAHPSPTQIPLERTRSKFEAKEEAQERTLAALIVRHGHRIMFDDEQGKMTVAQFIADDFLQDEIIPRTTLLQKVLTEAAKLDPENPLEASALFMQDPDPEICQFAVNAVADIMPLSKSMQQGFVEEKDRLRDIVPQTLNSIKYFMICIRIDELKRSLKNSANNDFNTQRQIMQEIKEQSNIAEQFAKILDRVLIR